jgi:hypothetical protein
MNLTQFQLIEKVLFLFNLLVMSEGFADLMLSEFNLARTQPTKYIERVQSHLKYIKPNPEYKKTNSLPFMFDKEGIPKVALLRGVEAFNEFITFLSLAPKLEPLKLQQEIAIKPLSKAEYQTKREVIAELYMRKKKELGDKYKTLDFHYDYGTNNYEISSLLQLVDDNNSDKQRRNKILSWEYKYVGISLAKIKANRYCVYVTFAN